MSALGSRGVAVRPYREGDLDAIMEIERATFRPPWRRRRLAAVLGHPSAVGWVAELAEPGRWRADGGDPVGYGIGWVVDDRATLALLAVAECARGGGAGRGLVHAFARSVHVRGADRISVDVRDSNVSAIRFYDRLGFARAGRKAGYYEDPVEDAIVLRAALPLRGR